MLKNKKINPVGRPKKLTETKQSKTVSIYPTKLKRVEKLHTSLTKYLEACMLRDNI